MDIETTLRDAQATLDRLLRECLDGRVLCREGPCENPLCGTHQRQRLTDLLERNRSPLPSRPSPASLARLIDHTVLRPDATPDDIERGAREALDHGVAAYCVNPCHVDRVVPLLAGSPVVVCSVAGFPLGSSRTSTKVHEAFDSLSRGAREIDMVINIGLLRSGGYGAVRDDVAAVAEAVRSGGGVSKVILETALLTDRDIVAGCLIILEVGADFVKTSTGFSREGATVRGVALLHALAGGQLGIKAAGGIRTREAALTMVAAGATRIGTSSSATILTEPER